MFSVTMVAVDMARVYFLVVLFVGVAPRVGLLLGFPVVLHGVGGGHGRVVAFVVLCWRQFCVCVLSTCYLTGRRWFSVTGRGYFTLCGLGATS